MWNRGEHKGGGDPDVHHSLPYTCSNKSGSRSSERAGG